MMAAINEYLVLRRGAGFVLSNAQYLLRSFAAFAADRQQPFIRTATVIDWASRAPSSAQRHTRYQTVRQFAEYVHLEDHRHDLGHSTLATTEIYVRADPSQKLEAIEAVVPPHLRKG